MSALIAIGSMGAIVGVNMTPRKVLVNYDRKWRSPLVLEYGYGWPATMLENARLVDEARDAEGLAEVGKRLAETWKERSLGEEDLSEYGELLDVDFDGEWRWGGLAANIVVLLAIGLSSGAACEFVVRRRTKKTKG